jgi:signal transduction histidine kinase
MWTETLELSHAVYPFTVEYLGLENALKKLCYDTGAHSGVNVSFSAESAIRKNTRPPLPLRATVELLEST